ncbi:hypothetical protein DFJ74DRAFT_667781 [Hyaloraphidium curvatum]|nr:hypothetical protein DFJ74DRAFT_667781 [Hyaloraphidium curvatum]
MPRAALALLAFALLSASAAASAAALPGGASLSSPAQHPLLPSSVDAEKKKKKDPKPPKLPKHCSPVELPIPKGIEPSGSVFHDGTLWIVSDNSQLLSMTEDGREQQVYRVGEGKNAYDLESVAHVLARPEFLYLGVEAPQAILEYHIPTRSIRRTWDLSGAFDDLPENAGMEALGYVKTNRSATGGYFFAGCQHDARIFVFSVDLAAEGVVPPVLVAVITDHPGPDYDISDIAVTKHQLFLLFDKAKLMVQLDLNSHEKLLLPRTNGESPQLPVRISAANATHAHFEFPTRGQEGVAFSETHAFFSVDYGDDQSVLRYDFEQMASCFKKHGKDGDGGGSGGEEEED